MGERNADIVYPFGDDEHTFRLGIKELEELQEKCDAGPGFVLGRLMSPRLEWRIEDVRHTLRLGLIGGGMSSTDAIKLVKRYVDDRPAWAENAKIAQAVLAVAIFGPADEAPGEKQGKTDQQPNLFPEENGDLQKSTETAQ
jgi:hypothetical protein